MRGGGRRPHQHRRGGARPRSCSRPCSRNPQALPPATTGRVRRIRCVDLQTCGYLGFSALAVQEDRSFFERVGRRLGPGSVWDDGTDPAGSPRRSTSRGSAKTASRADPRGRLRSAWSTTPDRGARGTLLDRHGLPAPTPTVPSAQQFMAAGDSSREELVGGRSGSALTRFHYTTRASQAGHRHGHDARRVFWSRAASAWPVCATSASPRATSRRWPVSRRWRERKLLRGLWAPWWSPVAHLQLHLHRRHEH